MADWSSECQPTTTEEFIRCMDHTAQNNPVTMAVVGCAGQGKSTLVNSLLRIDHDRGGAKEGGLRKTETEVVRCYTNMRNGTVVKIWDTPGLDDSAHLNQEKVIKELRKEAGDSLDIILFCIAYFPGVRVTDKHCDIIKYLTKHFGTDIWKRTRLVLTMVNTVPPPKRESIPVIKFNIEEGLKKALRDAGVPQVIVDAQHLSLAGYYTEKLWISKREEIDWNKDFFNECLDTVTNDEKKITLTQSREGKSIWPELAKYLVAGGVGSGSSVLIGLKVGALCVGYLIRHAIKYYQKKND